MELLDKNSQRHALVVAHPGHELRVYHWMEIYKPLYCCLTDGSGGAGLSRVQQTGRLLQETGARIGPIYGRYTDKMIYNFLLHKETEIFEALTIELAEAFISSEIMHVTGDAIEGFNPVHDICRIIIDGAVSLVYQNTGRLIYNTNFVLDDFPSACPEFMRSSMVEIRLDDAAVHRKMQAAFEYLEMRYEVSKALKIYGTDALNAEYLRPSTTGIALAKFKSTPPYYESFGEMRRKEGRYQEIIRYHEHVFPVLRAIEKLCCMSVLSEVT